jgi:hypothetical protein
MGGAGLIFFASMVIYENDLFAFVHFGKKRDA